MRPPGSVRDEGSKPLVYSDRITEFTVAAWPWLMTMLVSLVVVTYWPTLWGVLPKTRGMM